MESDNYEDVRRRALRLLGSGESGAALAQVCRLMRDQLATYDWVGFYIAVPAERVLVLGPFEGKPTEHVRIPYGRGLCGRSAEREDVVLVQDVSREVNYLACSLETRSEIVVPVFHSGGYVGQIDVDSHTVNAFSREDRALLEDIAGHAGPLVAEISAELSA